MKLINEYEHKLTGIILQVFCTLEMKTMKVGFGTLTICEVICCIVYVVGMIGHFDSDK